MTDTGACVELRTFGEARADLHIDSSPAVRTVSAGKPLALLVYLASAPRRVATREHLVDLLWSDVPPDLGRLSLRQALHSLRRGLSAAVIQGDSTAVRIGIQLTFDRATFLAAADGGEYEAAVACYHGDFFPNFASPGAAEFERWLDLERIRLRAVFIRCAGAAIRDRLAGGRARDALQLARLLRDCDPDSELSWRLVLHSLLATGDLATAAAEVERLEQTFLEHGALEPATDALIALTRQRGRPAAHPDRAPLLAPDLIAREAEFAALLRAWHEVANGQTAFVELTGAAGFGKTRILHDARARIRGSRGRVVLVAAAPGDRDVEFAYAAALANGLARLPGAAGISRESASVLVSLDPALSSVWNATADMSTGDDALRRRALAIKDLVTAVSDDAPLALLLDDLHWSDSASVRVLRNTFSRLGRAALLVVAASRQSMLADPGHSSWRTVTLRAFSVPQVAEFIESAGALPDSPWSETLPRLVHGATGGCPLFVLEALQFAIDRAVLRLEQRRWSCTSPALLDNQFRDGHPIHLRLVALSASARQLLNLVAIAGIPMLLTSLASIVDDPSFVSGLRELEHRGLVVNSDGSIAPAHDEIAAIAEAGMTEPDRARAHAAIGGALLVAASGEKAVIRSARHLYLAGELLRLKQLYRETIRGARGFRPAGSLLDIAALLLGPGACSDDVRALSHTAPFMRRPLARSVAMLGAALALVGGVAGTRWVAGAADHFDNARLLLISTVDHPGMRAVALKSEPWQDGVPIDPSDHALPVTNERPPSADAEVAIPIVGDLWLESRPRMDGTGSELVIYSGAGVYRRAARTPGDDRLEDISPDERFAVVSTGRWNTRGHSSLAIVDLRTGGVRRLTHQDAFDHGARWSLDGTRIAFARRYYSGRASDMCVVTFDGQEERCAAIAQMNGLGPVGWLDHVHVATVAWQQGEGGLFSHSVDSDSTVLLLPRVDAGRISRDGRWMWMHIGGDELTSTRVMIAPTSRLTARRPLLDDRALRSPHELIWDRPRDGTDAYVSRLTLRRPSSPLPLDASFQLSVRAFAARGDELEGVPLRWSSRDSTIATVDHRGILTPHRRGNAWIVVSAGGWRTDSAIVAIDSAGALSVSLLRETWDPSFGGRWHPFGMPLPFTSRTPQFLSALVINGDSSYTSGVYSRGEYEVGGGIVLRATISVPQSRPQWQVLVMDLAELPSGQLAEWDHAHGPLPRALRSCEFGVPLGEGSGSADSLYFATGERQHVVATPTRVRKGQPVSVDIQILPDGRCSFALDGVARWTTGPTFAPSDRVRAVFHGMSVGTTVAVGPVEIMTRTMRATP